MITKTFNEILASVDLTQRLSIARQFYPSLKENRDVAGFTDDPMGEKQISEHSGCDFVHKYPDRLLVLASDRCPALCRFCTRKRITYQTAHRRRYNFKNLSSYLENHIEIKEVIFSGGDPFMLSNEEILKFMNVSIEFSHIKKLRFHSRALTLIPERFDNKIFRMIGNFQKENPETFVALVIHVNHSLEISQKALEVIRKFKECGVHVLSQTVLLRRINNSTGILTELFKKLYQVGVQPYYLHQLDRITGSAHFEVPVEEGRRLFYDLKASLPENMIPAYVMDGPQGKRQICY